MNQTADILTKAAPSATSSADAIRATVIERLRATELKTHPSAYIFVRDIFPADYYAAIQENFPPESLFQATKPGRTPNPRAILYRKQINLAHELDLLEEAKRPCWALMRAAIDHPDFVRAVFDKFAGPMHARYGKDSLDVRIRLEVLRDQAGFALGPHTDVPHKVFTGLFYMPKDDSQRDLGTSVFVPKQRNFADESGQQFPFNLFEEHERLPFIPNSMFMFMKTQNSFHGRYEIPPEATARNWMNCSIQLASRFTE